MSHSMPPALARRTIHLAPMTSSFCLIIPLPLSGAPGIECRNGGITQIIFTFPTAVTINSALGTQGAQVTSGTGSVSSVSGAGATGTVNLTGVTNLQWITVTLFGVSDGTYTNDVA